MTKTSPFTRIIIVNYNGGEFLRTCLESIYARLPGDRCEIVIVDNASQDASLAMLRAEFPQVHLIENHCNVGFGTACNQGAAFVQAPAHEASAQVSADYFFFVNPDCRFEEDVLTPLVTFMEETPDAGACGPRLLNADGSLQPSRGRFPTLVSSTAYLWSLKRLMPSDEAVIGSASLHSARFPARILARFFAQYAPLEPVQRVDYLTGACLLVRADLFTEVGGYDERFFLYYEEIDLCKRLTERGAPVYYLAGNTVWHQVAACSGADPFFTMLERRRSMLQYFRKHGSPSLVMLHKIMMLLEFFIRSAVLRVSGEKRSALEARIEGLYLRHLRGLVRRG